MKSQGQELSDKIRIVNLLSEARQELKMGRAENCLKLVRVLAAYDKDGLLDEAQLTETTALGATSLKLFCEQAG